MLKKLSMVVGLGLVVLIAGCTVTVTPTASTTVKTMNNLTSITVNINGTSVPLDEIDLYNVTVGDVVFPYVAGGNTTSAQVTHSSGLVYVDVDSAVGYINGHGVYLFTGISSITKTLTSGVENTVTFDGSSFLFATVTIRTKVKVENDLTNLSVDVGGTTTNVAEIDLAGITIGDVVFPFVQGGTISAAEATNSSGTVTVTIDSAYVRTTVLGLPVTLPFAVLTTMNTTITPGITNTVVFDESTAATIIQALGKKKIK
jgi:hypothetical protein